MTCKHKQIRTWVFEDTKEPAGLWSCVDCGLKFKPIIQNYLEKDNCVNATEWQELTWHDLPEEWVGNLVFMEGAKWASVKLKEKNT